MPTTYQMENYIFVTKRAWLFFSYNGKDTGTCLKWQDSYGAAFQRAAPSNFPGPDSCTKATTRILLVAVPGLIFISTSWAKLLPFGSFPIFAICCTTATCVKCRPPFSPCKTCEST